MFGGHKVFRHKGIHTQLQRHLVDHVWRFDVKHIFLEEAPPIYEYSSKE